LEAGRYKSWALTKTLSKTSFQSDHAMADVFGFFKIVSAILAHVRTDRFGSPRQSSFRDVNMPNNSEETMPINSESDSHLTPWMEI
jgi:hypothetical protein